MKKTARRVHFLKTEHFHICTEWPESDDRFVTEKIEGLYTKLSEQFNIPAGKHIWAGRLFVFAFQHKESFGKFYKEASGRNVDVDKVGGFGGYQRQMSYIIINAPNVQIRNPKERKDAFVSVMIHEATHTFVQQAHGRRHIPSWVNEGIAESMADFYVPRSSTRLKLDMALKHLAQGKSLELDKLFHPKQNIPLDAIYYGASHGLVQMLVKIHPKKFMVFFKEIKSGKTDVEALKKVYNISREELLRQLTRVARR
ncbi:MAG TPA: hypothetical protein ENL03_05880 [Phycisphaerae bacterium]|nr:hypothetical protein [Phycisphaerae bacterium]